jgi:hypothetical protein
MNTKKAYLMLAGVSLALLIGIITLTPARAAKPSDPPTVAFATYITTPVPIWMDGELYYIASLDLEPGKYVITASLHLSNESVNTGPVTCILAPEDGFAQSPAYAPATDMLSPPQWWYISGVLEGVSQSLTVAADLSAAGGQASVHCGASVPWDWDALPSKVSVDSLNLHAIRVAELTFQ